MPASRASPWGAAESRQIEWLMAEGGPAIRYRTATEFGITTGASERKRLERALIGSRLVQRWLARLLPRTDFSAVHGSKPECLENVLGKLVQLGCRAGMNPLDERTRPIRDALARGPKQGSRGIDSFRRNLVAGLLFRAGYTDDAVMAQLNARLEVVSRIAFAKRYNIYVDPSEDPGYPKAFAGRPLLDPRLCPHGETPLPSINLVHALAALRPEANTRRRIDAVARYFADPPYAQLPRGYGVVLLEPRRFWSIGWDVRLPPKPCGELVQNLELFAAFPAPRRMASFVRGRDALDEHRTSRGGWSFPRELLPERLSGYWVNGCYLALEDARRSRRALELESTFYALSIMATSRPRRAT